VAEEFVQVVHGPEQLDLGVDAGGAAVVQMASESLEQLSETGLDQGAAAGVELAAGRGGEAGSHVPVTRWDGCVLKGFWAVCLAVFLGD
jgi:hypothetical protein